MCILVLSQGLFPCETRVFLREQRCLMSQTYGLSINLDWYVNVYVIYDPPSDGQDKIPPVWTAGGFKGI